jgi:hypothetical protein
MVKGKEAWKKNVLDTERAESLQYLGSPEPRRCLQNALAILDYEWISANPKRG